MRGQASVMDFFMEISSSGIERKTAVGNEHGEWVVSSIRRKFDDDYVVDETAVYPSSNDSLLDSIYVVGNYDYHETAIERLSCGWNPHHTEQETA